ncbi:hypothetical protein LTR10_004870 [Elasticomyces elasticus]|nr:hypothetical protein LTR10_004870 [Elasticomyces elasticus]KAK4977184.1 hypothetical protein LTR42_003232 [Elasticomyces elasticus]
MAPEEDTTRLNAIDKLEERTCRRIGIQFNEHEAAGKFNEQSNSLLFSILPPEIRDLIWAFATAPFEDTNAVFEDTEYYYRPGHTARLRTDTALLRTCRRVWLEANAMPMLQAEHSFYLHRAAPDKRDPKWMSKLTEHNRRNFGELHLFVQMCNIEHLTAGTGMLRSMFLRTLPEPGDFQPRVLHVTLRHTDWYWWESDEPLRLQDSWVKALLNSPDLRSTQVFRLEMETLDYKVDQMMTIVERIKTIESEAYDTHIVDGNSTKTQFVLDEKVRTYDWDGPPNIANGTWDPYQGRHRLKYHVVTLTWRLRFPDIPRAFVPELRRAPRVPSQRINLASPNLMEKYAVTGPITRERRLRPAHLHRRRKEQFGRMRRVGREILYVSQRQAEAVQKAQRRQFEEWQGAGYIKELEALWKEEGSLLKFID